MYGIRLPPMLSRNGGVPNGCVFRQIHRKVPTVPCLWQEGIRPAAHAHSFCRNKRQEEYLAVVSEYQKKEKSGFVNEEERQKLQFDIEKAKRNAEEARKRLDKLDDSDTSSPISEVRKSIGKKYEADKLKKKAEETTVVTKPEEKKKTFVTDSFSKLSRSERKLVSKILTIITDVAPKEVAEQIIDKIKEEMK